MSAPTLTSVLVDNWQKTKPYQHLTVTFLLIVLIQFAEGLPSNSALFSSPVWLTAGVALGLCFFYGKKAAPAIFLGAITPTLINNLGTINTNEIVFGAFHAFCLTLQSIAIYLGFRQLTHKQKRHTQNPLASHNNLLIFLALCGFIGTIAALLLNMNHSIFIGDKTLQASTMLDVFLTNTIGLIALSPLFIVWRFPPKGMQHQNHALEWLSWLSAIMVLGYVSILHGQPVLIYTIALLIWSVARLGQQGCALGLIASTLLIMSELTSGYPFDSRELPAWLNYHALHAIWPILLITSLYFSTLQSDLRKNEAKLDDMVLQRTQDLSAANQELKDEVFVRQQAEKSFRTSSRRYRALIETAGIPIIVLDPKFCIKQWNSAAESLFGYHHEEMTGINFIDTFIPEKDQDEIAWKFTRVIESGIHKENMESEITSYDGLTHIMLWNMNHLADNENESGEGQLLLIGQNISEIRKTQDQLHYLAHFDALTKTANRRLFEDRCNQAIQSAMRHKHQIALIGLDIDHFKRINDTLGHDVGDQFLVAMASRLKSCIRKEDTIARLGGDEFAVLLANVSGQEGAEIVARNILESIVQPVTIKGNELLITSSIGITLCPTDGSHYPDLLKNADMAMYRAKKAGRNNIQFYSPEMNEEMARQIYIEQELRTAFQQDQFCLYYQPIIDIETGEVVALEALLRWIHPQKGTLRPEYFLHIAEQTGQLHSIGEWAIHNACLQGQAIHEWSRIPIQIAINLSSRQYHHPGLVKMVKNITRETHFNPHNLILEMSESTITSNMGSAFTTLQELSQLGVSLTIDSFGTGLSSLRQLKQIPIDIIKIDRTFVNGIPEDENDMAITETLLTVANQMDLKTFATGVETKQQEAFLKINGCRYAQGYLYAAPMPFNKLPKLFENIRAGQSLHEGEQAFLPFEHNSNA